MMAEFEFAHFRSEWELQAGVLIWQIFSPIFIIFGTVGNVLSIKILSKRRFNKWASSMYLIGLSAADLSILYLGLLRQWIKYLVDIDIRHTSEVVCKMHWWLMYSNADISVWILIAVTVERLISTLCPYTSKIICTRIRAKIVLVIICLCALFINSHLLYGVGVLEISQANKTIVNPCGPLTDEYAIFFGKVWTWIDLCKFSLIPFAFLSFGNVCIIYRVISSQRKVKLHVGRSSTANMIANTTMSNIPTTPVAASSFKKSRTSSTSMLLVALNIMFITCTAPICIYFIGEPYWIPKDIPKKIQLKDPWWAFVNMLMYINNTSNFILYCASGSRFREELGKMFAWPSSRLNTAATSSTQSAGRLAEANSLVL